MRRGRGHSGRYRPERAWLGHPGDGIPLRRHRRGRWHFRWTQLRVLAIALALALAALAWLPLMGMPIARMLGLG